LEFGNISVIFQRISGCGHAQAVNTKACCLDAGIFA
jgi:hypothetical protein